MPYGLLTWVGLSESDFATLSPVASLSSPLLHLYFTEPSFPSLVWASILLMINDVHT